jgi:hypothetical protein
VGDVIEVSGYGRYLRVQQDDVVVTGHRYNRGSSSVRGGGHFFGWRLVCTCGWERRVNDTKREATATANRHLGHEDHP